MFQVVIKKFGTEDLEWFCATETILNILFNIKARNSPEYAKYFINQLVQRMYNKPGGQQQEEVNLDNEDNQVLDLTVKETLEVTTLRNDLTDLHYA